MQCVIYDKNKKTSRWTHDLFDNQTCSSTISSADVKLLVMLQIYAGS